MAIGEALRRIRKAQKIKQRTIAEIVGVAVDTYRRWETGKHSIKAEKLKRLANILGVTVDEILG